jgi:hypothetical protein
MFGGAFTIVRLGFAGYMRCPVGKHRTLVKPVNEADLTEQERQILEGSSASQEGDKLNNSIGVLVGVVSLAIAIVTQTWWAVVLAALWVMLWGRLLVRELR